MTLYSAIDVLDIVGRSLKVAGCIVALGDEDVVSDAALQWLVQWNRWTLLFLAQMSSLWEQQETYHELLLDSAETLEASGKLDVVVCGCLCNCGNNGDVVALRTDVVSRRDHCNVDIYPC